MRNYIVGLCLLGLASCHLLDQRDFDPRAGDKPEPPAGTPPPPGPGALLTIKYASGDPDYAASLREAVQRALSLKAGVLFSVEALVPPAATPDAQEAALHEAAATSREICEAIATDGADSAQIEQSVRTDPAVQAKEVRVYVH